MAKRLKDTKIHWVEHFNLSNGTVCKLYLFLTFLLGKLIISIHLKVFNFFAFFNVKCNLYRLFLQYGFTFNLKFIYSLTVEDHVYNGSTQNYRCELPCLARFSFLFVCCCLRQGQPRMASNFPFWKGWPSASDEIAGVCHHLQLRPLWCNSWQTWHCCAWVHKAYLICNPYWKKNWELST